MAETGGWAPAGLVLAAGLAFGAPFITLPSRNVGDVRAAATSQAQALHGIAERPLTQPQEPPAFQEEPRAPEAPKVPEPTKATPVGPVTDDERAVLTPGILTAVENGWARVVRGPGSIVVEILDPQTGGVGQTLTFLREDAIPPGVQTAIENGWAKTAPLGKGWVRVDFLPPVDGMVEDLPPPPPKSKGIINVQGF